MEGMVGPRYLTLRETLARELAAGRWPVGARFPTEEELRRRFGVSRHTVREALRGLEEAGLIARQAGSGTVVLAGRPPAFVQSVDTLAHLLDYAQESVLEAPQVSMVTAGPPLAEQLGCAAGTRWLRAAGLRRLVRQAVPLCWTEVFVAEAYAAVRDALPQANPIFAVVERRFGLRVAEVEQRMSAVALPEALATPLASAPSAPALLLRRRYFAEGQSAPFEVSLSLLPGDRFAHVSRLRRSAALAGGMAA